MTEIRPASTVMCIRESADHSPEVLLLRRNTEVEFASGFWVFPGGKIEKEETNGGTVEEQAAKLAAVREAEEEAGLRLNGEELTHFCHWTTPSPSIKRFGTWFFMTLVPGVQSKVTIDDSEIKDHRWVSPMAALAMLKKGEMKLLPPTFLIIQRIKHCENYNAVQKELLRSAPLVVNPKVGIIDGIFQSMYPGDAGYELHDVHCPGPRHRLIGDIKKGTYGFEYHGCDEVFPLHGGYDW